MPHPVRPAFDFFVKALKKMLGKWVNLSGIGSKVFLHRALNLFEPEKTIKHSFWDFLGNLPT